MVHQVPTLIDFALYLNPNVWTSGQDEIHQWGTTDIQSCPIKLPPLLCAPAV